MTKREIKTVIRQCYKGLDYYSGLRVIIKLTAPELPNQKCAEIVENIAYFYTNYVPTNKGQKGEK